MGHPLKAEREIESRTSPAAETYFLYNGVASTTDQTDVEGDVVDDYTYDVFGAVRSQSMPRQPNSRITPSSHTLFCQTNSLVMVAP